MARINTNEYISAFSKDVQAILQKVRATISKSAPIAQEAMIYGVPGFKINGKNLVVYAAFKKHIGFYPEPEIIDHFRNDLKDYKTSKGAIQFSYEKPIPYELIARMVKYKAELL